MLKIHEYLLNPHRIGVYYCSFDIEIDDVVKLLEEAVNFDKVLLVGDGDRAEIGKPYVAGATVAGKILRQGRDKKVLVMKYHSKTRYRRKRGHRQSFTEVEITNV